MLGRKIWMPPAAGRMCRITARFGFRTSRKVGLRIAMATGRGSLTMAGPGWVTSPGDGRRITMDAGYRMEARGAGGRDRCGGRDSTVLSGRRRMSRSLGLEAVGDLVSVLAGVDGAASAGCRSGLATGSIRGGVGMVGASGWSVTIVSAQGAALADLRRCTREHDIRIWRTSTMHTLVVEYRRFVPANVVRDVPQLWPLRMSS